MTHERQNTASARYLFWAALLIVYTAVWFSFYPKYYLARDESIYLRGAFYLLKGLISDRTMMMENAADGRLMYPLGNSALIAPFLAAGFKHAFLTNFFLIIAATFLFAKILKKLSLPVHYSALLLLNPSVFLFSRTLMSEIGSCFLLVWAILFYLGGSRPRRDRAVSFALFGAACCVKYANAVYLAVFAVFYLIEQLRKKDIKGMICLAGAAVPLLFVFGQNLYTRGDLLKTGYMPFPFNVANVPRLMPEYFLALNINYPLMLISTLFYRGRLRGEMVTLTSLYLLIFSGYGFGLQGSSIGERAVAGVRFILPAFPVMLIMYASFIENIISRARVKTALMAAVLSAAFMVVCADIYVAFRHEKETAQAALISSVIHANTSSDRPSVVNFRAWEYFNPAIAERDILFDEDTDRLLSQAKDLTGGTIVFFFKNTASAERKDLFFYDESADRESLEKLIAGLDAVPAVDRKYDGKELLVYKFSKETY